MFVIPGTLLQRSSLHGCFTSVEREEQACVFSPITSSPEPKEGLSRLLS